MFESSLIWIGIILIIYYIYKRIRRNENYFKIRGIPYIKPTFLLGETGKVFLRGYTIPDYIQKIYKTFPNENIYGLFDFLKPLYFIRDPEMLRKLMVKDFDHFLDHNTFLNPDNDEMFGNSLFMLRGDKWRDMRATLSPAFTGSKMRLMFEFVSECADRMCKYYVEKTTKIENGSVQLEMNELCSRYSTDVIATCAFGIEVNSFENKNNEFYEIGQRSVNFKTIKGLLRVICIRIVPKLMKFLDIQFIEKSVGNFFRSMVLNTMEIRKKENIFRPDMIHLLMQIRDGNVVTNSKNKTIDSVEDNNAKPSEGFAIVQESEVGKRVVKRQWNDNEIVAQCFLFFAAGFDTTSTVLSFLIYELTLHKAIQNRLYKEIYETHKQLADKKLTYDILQKLQYMDMVTSEILRKWPPAPVTDRICIKDYQYDDDERYKFIIEKDTAVWIPIYSFHHDPNYFPNPEQFDPERFNSENIGRIKSGTYLPFGIGPRNCIGSRFALMEIKIVIYYLLLNFEFEPFEKTQIPIKLLKSPMGIVPEKGIHVEFKIRK